MQIAHRRRSGATIASRYADRLGVPAIFPRRAFSALRRVDGDRGAREILNSGASQWRVVALDMPEARADIDTQTDAAAASVSGG
jgi:CTP:molybdopterin cytidylyltransferase MocA